MLLGAGRLETWGFPSGSAVKKLTVMEKTQEMSGRFPGGGHGNSLQYSCLENPMERGAWQATVPGVAKSRTRLGDFTSLTAAIIACEVSSGGNPSVQETTAA